MLPLPQKYALRHVFLTGLERFKVMLSKWNNDRTKFNANRPLLPNFTRAFVPLLKQLTQTKVLKMCPYLVQTKFGTNQPLCF